MRFSCTIGGPVQEEIDRFQYDRPEWQHNQSNYLFIKTLDSLITSDINTSSDKILNNPWRGA